MSLDFFSFSDVVLAVCARGIKKADTFSNTDSFAVVSILGPEGDFVELGRTSVIADSQDPDWTEQFPVVYYFEEKQTVQIEVFDDDGGDAKSLGAVAFPLGRLVSSAAMVLHLELPSGGKVTVRSEEKIEAGEYVKVQLRGRDLANRDTFLFGKSDPFFELARANEDGSFTTVYRSAAINNNKSPVWPTAVFSCQKISRGDMEQPLRVEVKDHDSDGTHETIGVFMTSLEQLSEAGRSWKVMMDGDEKGSVEVHGEPSMIRIPTFLDYVNGGLELKVTVAVDYTASNGDPQKPGTLHHCAEGHLNQYQDAIRSCLTILSEYDDDKQFDLYGFGAKVDGSKVQHIFPVGGENPKEGVAGVMDAYSEGMAELALSGPTMLNPILRATIQRALRDKAEGTMAYSILLVICDGSLTDIDMVMDTLVESALDAPVSVVMVGVGGDPFEEMDRLDGDEDGLRNGAGERCPRDVVQFIPMRDFQGRRAGARLAKTVLAEIPDQVLAYHFANGVAPTPPPAPEGDLGNNLLNFHTREAPIPPTLAEAREYGLPGFGTSPQQLLDQEEME